MAALNLRVFKKKLEWKKKTKRFQTPDWMGGKPRGESRSVRWERRNGENEEKRWSEWREMLLHNCVKAALLVTDVPFRPLGHKQALPNTGRGNARTPVNLPAWCLNINQTDTVTDGPSLTDLQMTYVPLSSPLITFTDSWSCRKNVSKSAVFVHWGPWILNENLALMSYQIWPIIPNGRWRDEAHVVIRNIRCLRWKTKSR